MTVFFHLHPVEAPTVPDEERYHISRFSAIPAIPGCYRVVVKHGFMDEVLSPDLAFLIYQQLEKFIISQSRHGAGAGTRRGWVQGGGLRGYGRGNQPEQ